MSKADGFPDLGMRYENVRKKIKNLTKKYKDGGNKDILVRQADSLLNQAKGHQGQGAKEELLKELDHNGSNSVDTNNHSSSRCGWDRNYAEKWENIFKV